MSNGDTPDPDELESLDEQQRELLNALRRANEDAEYSKDEAPAIAGSEQAAPGSEPRLTVPANPEPPQHATPPEPLGERSRNEQCVLIGPSKAGKTCMLAAINAACYAEGADPGFHLSIVSNHDPDNDGQHLPAYVVDWIGGSSRPPATEFFRNYEIEIATRVRGGLFRAAELVSMTIRCGDGPGGGFFPRSTDHRDARVPEGERAKLLRQAADASALVFVFDWRDPTLDLIEMHLPTLLDQISRPSGQEELPQSWPVRWMSHLKRPPWIDHGRRSRVKASRVLILITKIDELALEISRQEGARGRAGTPLAVAHSLDSLGLALELFGPRTLRRIRRAMDIRAQLAIGLVSATGFVRDGGDSFLSWGMGRGVEERLRHWNPYGIHEALLFMTTGRCTGSVQLVSDDDDLDDAAAMPVSEFPFVGGQL